MSDPELDLDRIERAAKEVLSGYSTDFVLGRPSNALAMIARIRELETENKRINDFAKEFIWNEDHPREAGLQCEQLAASEKRAEAWRKSAEYFRDEIGKISEISEIETLDYALFFAARELDKEAGR